MESAAELADVIRQLRSELQAAMQAGEDELLRFEAGPVELELTIGVEKAAGSAAKVRFWVLDVGADARLASALTQRIKLTLRPRVVGMPDRDPLIQGTALPDER
jgi:hypothetical protein